MDLEERERRRILSILEESSDSDENELSASDCESEDHVSVRSEGSDTEQEASDSEDDIPLERLRCQFNPPDMIESESDISSDEQVRGSFYCGKDGTKWFKTPFRQNIRTRPENIITQQPGVTQEAKSAKSELECWYLFMTDEMLKIILNYTNDRIKERMAACPNPSKYPFMKEVNMSEIKAFIGLLYIAGFHRAGRQNLNDLWTSDGTGVDIFRLTMSQQRFHFINSCIAFDDKSTRNFRKETDNLAPIRQIFELFTENCQQSYVIGENATIDEMLVAFRGRAKFRQYIPSKPAKYGIKIFALVDAKNFYISNLEIYAGKQPEGPFAASNKPFDVVNRLVQAISKSSRNITFDNWFTSYELIVHLLKEHKLTCTGTLRKNKRQIPPEFTRTRGQEVYSSKFGYQKDITLMSHIPKKNKVVLLVSSLHHDGNIDESSGEKKKPEINTFYNITKGGVDVADELCATYNVCRNSKKWALTIFYAMLNMAGVNAGIIRNTNNGSNIKRRRFLKNLGIALVNEHISCRKNSSNLPREMRKRMKEFTGETSEEPPRKLIGVRRRCQDCPYKKDRKTSHTCNTCLKFICPEHLISYCKSCSETLNKKD